MCVSLCAFLRSAFVFTGKTRGNAVQFCKTAFCECCRAHSFVFGFVCRSSTAFQSVCVSVCFWSPVFVGKTIGITMILMGCIAYPRNPWQCVSAVCFLSPVFVGKTIGITMILVGCVPTQSMTVIVRHAQCLCVGGFYVCMCIVSLYNISDTTAHIISSVLPWLYCW